MRPLVPSAALLLARRQTKKLSYLMVLVLILALTSCTDGPTVPKETPTDTGILHRTPTLMKMGKGVSHRDLFDFRSMAAVPASRPIIRGIKGGGMPWAIHRARARLQKDGHLTVQVRGLVIAATGVNPAGGFFVTLSCEGTSATIGPAVATPKGDAHIRGRVALSSCLAPIVLVRVDKGATGPPGDAGPGGWLAVSGF